MFFSFWIEGRLRSKIPGQGLTELLPGAYLLLKRVTRTREFYLKRRASLLDQQSSPHSFLDFFLLHGQDIKLQVQSAEGIFDEVKDSALNQGAVLVFRKKANESETLLYYPVGAPSH